MAANGELIILNYVSDGKVVRYFEKVTQTNTKDSVKASTKIKAIKTEGKQ